MIPHGQGQGKGKTLISLGVRENLRLHHQGKVMGPVFAFFACMAIGIPGAAPFPVAG